MDRIAKMTTGAIFVLVVGIMLYLTLHDASRINANDFQMELSELRSGEQVKVDFAEKPTVLSVFTSWCPYCNEDAPKMVDLHEKYKDRINLYGINVTNRDERSEVESYVEEHGIEYPVLLDEDGAVYEYYGAEGFPALYFINTDGIVVDYIVGSVDQNVIDASFASLLSE
ncbi:thiol-disulfide isomerase/thioredoxin [Paenibacillus endophyticus]|uniref:Thiol-disulfide isomerase/thioredoxin n=1 Tax=Paenibacillus endophyticus TaxID=1294268 RepID=A0A7W5CDM1_9BACL|nr:TlpA disulfide reductase family protein [Paenibacillus endophyticus]MBB3155249.1 thiol-disulfide isomerase/thioredoxin [Paenibacillus endophyticus]